MLVFALSSTSHPATGFFFYRPLFVQAFDLHFNFSLGHPFYLQILSDLLLASFEAGRDGLGEFQFTANER